MIFSPLSYTRTRFSLLLKYFLSSFFLNLKNILLFCPIWRWAQRVPLMFSKIIILIIINRTKYQLIKTMLPLQKSHLLISNWGYWTFWNLLVHYRNSDASIFLNFNWLDVSAAHNTLWHIKRGLPKPTHMSIYIFEYILDDRQHNMQHSCNTW